MGDEDGTQSDDRAGNQEESIEELVARPTREDVLADLAVQNGGAGAVEDGDEAAVVAAQAREERERRAQMLSTGALDMVKALEEKVVSLDAGGELERSNSGRRVVEMKRPLESEVEELRATLQKKYSLSTIVRFENRTAQTVSKIKADLISGVWEPGWTPPNTVGPFEEVLWACGGSMWGRSNQGIVRYSQSETVGGGGGGSTASQTVTIEWENPWVLRQPVEDLRRFEASVSARRDLVASCHTLDLADEYPRPTNPFELRCVLERMGEARAYSVVEDPLKGGHDQRQEQPPEARIEGFLEKKQPPPGFRWQTRWFHLGVDGTLRYFVTALDSDGDQTQELKGVMHLRNVSAIDEAVGHETEFMIEHLEKPKKRQYHLRSVFMEES